MVIGLWGKGEGTELLKTLQKEETGRKRTFWEMAKLRLSLRGKVHGLGARETPDKSSRNQRGCLVEEEHELYVDAGDWTCHRGH